MEDPIEYHKRYRGKYAIVSKVPLRNKEDLSLAYTPGVGKVSTAVAKDRELAYQVTSKWNTIAIVSDGTAVLGLGDIGPYGALPVMEGKAILFKTFGGVDAVPICLDTKEPDKIVETVRLIAPGFGGINLEDISAPRCFEVEERLKKELDIPVFHDDQHGTAIVVLAGLLNALKLVRKEIGKVRVVINGAGAAGIAVAKMLERSGVKNLLLVDSVGITSISRKDLNSYKRELAERFGMRLTGALSEAVRGADVFIGVSKAGLLKKEHVESMNSDPIIFALANPLPEIMPDEAYAGGAAVVATGRSDFPNQVNNVLAFPGIFRGALDARAGQITDEMKLAAAMALAAFVKIPTKERIVPGAFEPGIAEAVAEAVKGAAGRDTKVGGKNGR
jgi:malate dehydrogenase (oxaloacetate-decarboxylating)